MQSFMYMLAGLAALAIGVDAHAISSSFTSVAASNATGTAVPSSIFGNTTFAFPTGTATAVTTTFNSSATAVPGEFFVCYPANQAIYTVITSVIYSTFIPSSTVTAVGGIPTTVPTSVAFPTATFGSTDSVVTVTPSTVSDTQPTATTVSDTAATASTTA